jgi:hypothetical protein
MSVTGHGRSVAATAASRKPRVARVSDERTPAIPIAAMHERLLVVVTMLSASMSLPTSTLAQPASMPATVSATSRPVYAGATRRGRVADDDLDAVASALARRFADRGVKVAVPLAVVVTEERKARAIDVLDERLAAAAAAFGRRQWDEARSAMTTALGIFEEGLAFTEDDDAWARYRELLLLVADAQLAANDRAAADETLLQLLAVEPHLSPAVAAKAKLSGQLVERMATLSSSPAAAVRATLGVKSRPPGARVLVDGRGAGRTPVAVEVPPGIHYVSVRDGDAMVTERVVVPPAGARVTARLGSAEAEAASALVGQLRGPLTKRAFTEAAVAVADVTFAAVVVPWGPTVQVLVARVTDGELDAVLGARLPRNDAQREATLFALVEAALTRADDGWVDVDDDRGLLRSAFLQGVGDEAAVLADESAPTSLPVIVGGVVGGVAVAAGAAAIIVFVVGNEMRKDEGFRYVVDTSGLQ